jgi:hypothetical protein
MKLWSGIFAEAGTIESGGVFGLLRGGLTWIAADKFPAVCQQLALLVCLEFEKHECEQEHAAVVQVESPTGDHLNPDQTVVMRPVINSRLPDSDRTTFVGLYWYNGFVFQCPGTNTFRLSIEDVQLGEFTIRACQELPK